MQTACGQAIFCVQLRAFFALPHPSTFIISFSRSTRTLKKVPSNKEEQGERKRRTSHTPKNIGLLLRVVHVFGSIIVFNVNFVKQHFGNIRLKAMLMQKDNDIRSLDSHRIDPSSSRWLFPYFFSNCFVVVFSSFFVRCVGLLANQFTKSSSRRATGWERHTQREKVPSSSLSMTRILAIWDKQTSNQVCLSVFFFL